MLWSNWACRTFGLGISPWPREPALPPHLAGHGADARADRRGLRLPWRGRRPTMQEHLQQQFTALIAGGAFEPVRRHLTAVERDDRMAEAVGQVWAMAARKAELGIKMDAALLVHAVRLRAIDHRRQLPRGGQPRRDALHFANYVDGKVVVHRLDGLLDEDGDYSGEGDTALQSAWLAATVLDPADTLASAMDLRDWVDGLADDDRELLAARFAGKTLSEIATATDKSVSFTFSRLRQLGGDLAAHAGFTAPNRRRSRTGSGRPHENASGC